MQLQMFKNENLGQVRVLGNNENPLFCLRDICEVLEHTNSSRMLEAINAEFGKGVTQSYPLQTNGGIQQATFITEPQLYFVLMRSDKHKVEPFRQWVVNEVLPSIRKQGYYGNKPQEIDFLKEKIALQQELIATKTQLIALQKESIKSLKKQRQDKTRLTTKERIFKLLSKGKSQSQVSIELGISRSAVAYYVSKERQNERD